MILRVAVNLHFFTNEYKHNDRFPEIVHFSSSDFLYFFDLFNANMAKCALGDEPASKDVLKPGQPADVGIVSHVILPKTWADVA